MAYETKVILMMIAESIGKAKSLKEAYDFVAKAASVEGLQLPTYEEFVKASQEET